MMTEPATHKVNAAFILAGDATFTVQNARTGGRYTYKVEQSKDKQRWYVSVLTGSDNQSDYTFFGTIFADNVFRLSNKLRMEPQTEGLLELASQARYPLSLNSKSVLGFEWVWKNRNALPAHVELYHEGRCGCCGRKLTTPQSVELGIGPECAKRTGLSFGA